MQRRRFLRRTGGLATLLAAGKAIDNAVLGYGPLVGTNLHEQDLRRLVLGGLDASPFEVDLGGSTVAFTGDSLRVTDEGRTETLDPSSATPEAAAAVDARFGLEGGPIEQFVGDRRAIDAGDVATEFESYEAFFERLESAGHRPLTVESLRDRRWMGIEPRTVVSFADARPTDPRSVVDGLAAGFREHTYYDAPRYVAGSIEDNVLGGVADLRAPFRSPASFEAIERGEDTGLFCWELTHRSMEALQAVPAHRQDPPVFGWEVYDRRHGHMYTAIGSAYRRDGELALPMTFVDYSRSTWYDHYGLRPLFGEGIDAYDRRHRATRIGRPR